MKLDIPGTPHLTYCTNIHPGETWEEVRANLVRYLPAVRERVAAGRAFGVGLRLSAEAATALSREQAFEDLHALLRAQHLYVHTLNGFPYGRFHGEPVKQGVYLPDWLDERRLDYTGRLASLLAELLPTDQPALEGCISSVPGAFRARIAGEAEVARMVELLLRHAVLLHRVAERRGRVIVLALEPEPCCYLETVADAVRFFEERLFAPAARARFAALAGIDRRAAEAVLRRHLGVCADVCHLAVEFEEPAASLEALRAAGIRIGKIQLSAGLRVNLPGAEKGFDADEASDAQRESDAFAAAAPGGRQAGSDHFSAVAPPGRQAGSDRFSANVGASANGGSDPFSRGPALTPDGAGAVLERLRDFADSVYLHQVVERRDGALRRFLDLPEALRALAQDPSGAREWRVHFHVPVFLSALGPFGNTQAQLEATLRLLRERPYTQHLEVETYTWDVLPQEYRRDDIVTSIARELNWVRERLTV